MNSEVHRKRLERLQGYALVTLTITFYVLGQVLSKHVANNYEGVSIPRFVDPVFLCGYALLLVRGGVWILALRSVPLSRAYPLLSLSFPLVLVISVAVFDEPLKWTKCAGSIFLVLGVSLTAGRP